MLVVIVVAFFVTAGLGSIMFREHKQVDCIDSDWPNDLEPTPYLSPKSELKASNNVNDQNVVFINKDKR